MGLFKRGQIWWMSFMCDGKQLRRSTQTRDKKTATIIYHKVMTKMAEGKWLESKSERKETFQEMMQKYMREHSVLKKRSTLRDEASLKHLLPFFSDRLISKIRPSLVSSYKSARLLSGAAPATVNRELALLKHAFNLAVKEWEWIEDNPILRVSMEKEPPAKDRWLAEDEERKVISTSPNWLTDIIIFALDTGCRRGEILSLSWKHLDLTKSMVTIFGKKTGEWRGIPLTRRVSEMLAAKQAGRKVLPLREELVFMHPTGRTVNIHELRWAFELTLTQADIKDLRFHDLRHTFATRLAQQGIDLFTIQKLLGHKSFGTTQRYAHHCAESLRRGINALDARVVSLQVEIVADALS
ncbi:MAG: tyrosine-type recombinase/integrase [Syntrophorhabdaceae bacterium]